MNVKPQRAFATKVVDAIGLSFSSIPICLKVWQLPSMIALNTMLIYFSLASTSHAARNNDYPTVAIADYVFACMATNGQSRQALERCSCSVDVISSLMTYEQYVEAETVMRMRLLGGEKTTIFRTGRGPKEAFARLKRAQAEAEIRCF